MPSCAGSLLALVLDGTNELSGNESVLTEARSAAVGEHSGGRLDLSLLDLERLKDFEGKLLIFSAFLPATPLKL